MEIDGKHVGVIRPTKFNTNTILSMEQVRGPKKREHTVSPIKQSPRNNKDLKTELNLFNAPPTMKVVESDRDQESGLSIASPSNKHIFKASFNIHKTYSKVMQPLNNYSFSPSISPLKINKVSSVETKYNTSAMRKMESKGVDNAEIET